MGQPNTWTSFVTGGQLPYQGQWWRKYASEPAASLVGTSNSGSSSFTAGSWTFAPDRCEDFILYMTINSADMQQWQTYNKAVHVMCPPPPPPPPPPLPTLSARVVTPTQPTRPGATALVNTSGKHARWTATEVAAACRHLRRDVSHRTYLCTAGSMRETNSNYSGLRVAGPCAPLSRTGSLLKQLQRTLLHSWRETCTCGRRAIPCD